MSSKNLLNQTSKSTIRRYRRLVNNLGRRKKKAVEEEKERKKERKKEIITNSNGAEIGFDFFLVLNESEICPLQIRL